LADASEFSDSEWIRRRPSVTKGVGLADLRTAIFDGDHGFLNVTLVSPNGLGGGVDLLGG
jgi:hypothetical protein